MWSPRRPRGPPPPVPRRPEAGCLGGVWGGRPDLASPRFWVPAAQERPRVSRPSLDGPPTFGQGRPKPVPRARAGVRATASPSMDASPSKSGRLRLDGYCFPGCLPITWHGSAPVVPSRLRLDGLPHALGQGLPPPARGWRRGDFGDLGLRPWVGTGLVYVSTGCIPLGGFRGPGLSPPWRPLPALAQAGLGARGCRCEWQGLQRSSHLVRKRGREALKWLPG